MRIVPLIEVPLDAAGNPVSEFRVLEDELPEPFDIDARQSVEEFVTHQPMKVLTKLNSSWSVTVLLGRQNKSS